MALLLLLVLAGAPAPAPPALTEDQKIEALLRTVDGMKDAVFVRNGTAYDGHAAAGHLRDKWRWKKAEVKTARDFIRVCASVSAQSGRPYLVRWKDGRVEKSADFLLAALERLEGRSAPSR